MDDHRRCGQIAWCSELRVSQRVDDPDSNWTRHHHLPTSYGFVCRNKGVSYVFIEIAYDLLGLALVALHHLYGFSSHRWKSCRWDINDQVWSDVESSLWTNNLLAKVNVLTDDLNQGFLTDDPSYSRGGSFQECFNLNDQTVNWCQEGCVSWWEKTVKASIGLKTIKMASKYW